MESPVPAVDRERARRRQAEGVRLFAQGRRELAVATLREAHALAPDDPQVLNTLAAVLIECGHLDEARRALAAALAAQPDFFEARFNLAQADARAGDRAAAEGHLRRCLALRPRSAEAMNELGLLAAAGGRPAEARDWFAAALEAKPGWQAARSNLEHPRVVEGAAAEALDGGHPARAMEILASAPREWRASARGAVLAARALHALGDVSAAARALEDAWDAPDADATYYARHAVACLRVARWDRLEEGVRRLEARRSGFPDEVAEPGIMTLLPGVDGASQKDWAVRWWRHAGPIAPRAPSPRRPGRLRVGYLSADFHAHATAYLMAEMLAAHDRGRFEVFALCHGRDDGSPERRAVIASVEHFVELRGLDDVAAAERIAAEDLDVLVDLKGFTEEARHGILGRKPARTQVSFLGYPGTLGHPAVEWIVADGTVLPARLEPDFTERVLRMPVCYQPNGRRRDIAPGRREDHALPPGAFVMACFNQPFKLTPAVFERWCALLHRIPGSVLWLLAGPEEFASRLGAAAARRGLDPARLVFAPAMPLERHLSRLALADVALDTMPYNSHTTASDAVRTGVPLVTVEGGTFAGRVASSIVRAAGCPELAFEEEPAADAFVERLASESTLRAALRARLLEDANGLFDPSRFCAAFEALLERCTTEREEERVGPPGFEPGTKGL